MKDLQSDLVRPALLSRLNFIDGEWQSALSRETFAVDNPAMGEVIANVPDSQPTDARAATDAASRTFAGWREKLPKERAAVLRKWHNAIVAKPAEDPPLTALALVRLAQEAGVPVVMRNTQ